MTFAASSAVHQAEHCADPEHHGSDDEPYEEHHRCLLCVPKTYYGRGFKT